MESRPRGRRHYPGCRQSRSVSGARSHDRNAAVGMGASPTDAAVDCRRFDAGPRSGLGTASCNIFDLDPHDLPFSVWRIAPQPEGMIDGCPDQASNAADPSSGTRKRIIYQLHLKSFSTSNDDGIGDFPGLISKLDYIADLGVNTLVAPAILPVATIGRRLRHQRISECSSDYGTLADFRHFVREAHARGIRVITELVVNHTSDQHPWFQRARSAKPGSPWREFLRLVRYTIRNMQALALFSWIASGPIGHGIRSLERYYWHRFYSHQPDLNFDNPQVLKAVLSVMRFWLQMGVDGLRLDAVPYLVEREGTNNENLPETHAILKRFRAELDSCISEPDTARGS